MYRALAIAVLLAGAALPAAAAAPDLAPACVAEPLVSTELPEPMPEPQLMGPVYCEATCETGTVSCTGNTSCSAVDADCPNQRGYVICDGVYHFCEKCSCLEGSIQLISTGYCCPYNDGTEEKDLYRCINGQWVYDSTRCGPSPRCKIMP